MLAQVNALTQCFNKAIVQKQSLLFTEKVKQSLVGGEQEMMRVSKRRTNHT